MQHTIHDNVTSIARHVSPFPQESKLYFPVSTRQAGWMRKDGKFEAGPGKFIVRDKDGVPVTLSHVGDNYKVLKNNELFPAVEAEMTRVIRPEYLRGVQVKEQMAYNGRDCYREYVFPNLQIDARGGGQIAYRMIVGNGYGSTAVRLIDGAIDFFCTNGMIVGNYERTARKHTSGLSITGLLEWLRDSVQRFTKFTHRIESMHDVVLHHTMFDPLFDHLQEKHLVNDRRRGALIDNTMYEARNRLGNGAQPTLWHLHSALTAEATHFTPRDTGNDHEANTRLKKQQDVNRVINAAEMFLREAA